MFVRSILVAIVLVSSLRSATAVVIRPVVNMHSSPTDDADVVSQARFGETVCVLEASGELLKIRTPDNYAGWAPGAALAECETAYEGNARINALSAHVYRERSIMRHAPLISLPFETTLKVTGSDDERWLEAILPDGRTGWIQRGDLELRPQPIDTTSMLALSRRFIGLPYTWGGTSSFGYDCSGFTQMLLRQRGILMPRDAADQAAWDSVTAVEKPDLEAGDLIFFGQPGGTITHTGVYLGQGEFIHATAHLKPVIQISSLDDPHWTEWYVCARRPK